MVVLQKACQKNRLRVVLPWCLLCYGPKHRRPTDTATEGVRWFSLAVPQLGTVPNTRVASFMS